MKAMIFAAGEGKRMMPLTLATPKPLLRVAERSLLEHQIIRLKNAGICDIVVNVAYLADQVIAALNAMDLTGLRVEVSVEEQVLETGGGILRALPLLGEDPFVLVNSDVWTDFDFRPFLKKHLAPGVKAHLVLVETPSYKPTADFSLTKNGLVQVLTNHSQPGYTFAGISIMCPSLIDLHQSQDLVFPLRDALAPAIQDGLVSGELHSGVWEDVGTPDRLEKVRKLFNH